MGKSETVNKRNVAYFIPSEENEDIFYKNV